MGLEGVGERDGTPERGGSAGINIVNAGCNRKKTCFAPEFFPSGVCPENAPTATELEAGCRGQFSASHASVAAGTIVFLARTELIAEYCQLRTWQ